MLVEGFMFLVGAVAGSIFTMAADFHKETRRKEHKPIIHMRGHQPAWFVKCYCEEPGCSGLYADGLWRGMQACYLDQDGHYWCERHLPADTRVAERAAHHQTEDGRCVTHDYKCPKPWEPY